MPLVEYAKRNKKRIQGIPKTPCYKFIYLFILLFFSYTNFGLYIQDLAGASPHVNAVVDFGPRRDRRWRAYLQSVSDTRNSNRNSCSVSQNPRDPCAKSPARARLSLWIGPPGLKPAQSC
jgi:hypothetical protein